MDKTGAKILVVSRGVWDDKGGTSSTLTSLFSSYDPDKMSHIYIETKKPCTTHCKAFFQISEYSLVKKIFRWRTKTGHRVDNSFQEDEEISRREENTMQYVRKHRSFFYTMLREVLWHLNGWRSDELKSFIREENPDVVWLTGSPLILMNRLSKYVVRQAGKPYCIYEMDDVYSYKNCVGNPFKYIYRFFLRKRVKSLVKGAGQVFVISPKMKREFDGIFGIDSVVLTKGIDFSNRSFSFDGVHEPVRMVYTGQLLYGRLSSVAALAKALDAVNGGEQRIVLNIYTKTYIPPEEIEDITRGGSVIFCPPVSYSEVNGVVSQSDVVLFVESFEDKFRNIARLSFSTKLTDYLAGGKCIFAIGPDSIAPIEYLRDNDAAVIVSDPGDLRKQLEYLLSPGVIERYARSGYACGERNHDKSVIDTMLFSRLNSIGNDYSSVS